MNQLRQQTAGPLGIAAVALLSLMFYGLANGAAAARAAARNKRQHSPATPQANRTAALNSSPGLTPSAAPAAAALPNFVDLVQAVKPAVVSIRVKSDVTPQVTADDGGGNPFEGTPFERFFRQFGQPGTRIKGQGRDRGAISMPRGRARASSSAPTGMW